MSTKYTKAQKEFAKKLLIPCAIYRDSLPYREEFDVLHQQYQESGLPQLEPHDFWLLLGRAGKEGGAAQDSAVELPNVVVSEEEKYEMIRLCPATIGSRDRLPYTSEFDDMYKRFVSHINRELTKNDFWRALSKTAKGSRKPSVVDINPSNTLSDTLISQLRDMNPWWNVDVPLNVPKFKRSIFETVYSRLTNYKSGHKPFLGLRGPRQVGKSTVMEQLIQTLIYDKRLVSPQQVLRVSFDVPGMQLENPITTITHWFEESVVKDTFNSMWTKKKPVFLFFDEIQEVPQWSKQLKAIIDFKMCKAFITGSSARLIFKGQESLPGRLDTYNLNPLSLPEVAELQGIDFRTTRKPAVYSDLLKREFWKELSEYQNVFLDSVFERYCRFGGYPKCHVSTDITLADRDKFLQDHVTVRMIEHDLSAEGGRGGSISKKLQDNTLLRRIFIILCKYTGQSIKLDSLRQEIDSDTGVTIKNDELYEIFDFFDNSMLLRFIRTSQHRYARPQSQVKPCLCDHAIRAAWLEEVSLCESTPNEDMAGHIVEGMVGYLLSSIDGISISYIPDSKTQGEIDYIIEIADKHIPVEVKYRNKLPQFKALEDYLSNPVNNAPFGLVVTKDQSGIYGAHKNIIAIPLKNFLLLQ